MRILDMNGLMKRLYSSGYDLGGVELPGSLDSMIEAGVVLHQGCYVLKRSVEANPHIRISQFEDQTAYEAFLNHLHTKDYGDDRLPAAFRCLEKISNMLRRDFPGVGFLGEVSSNRKGHDCVVRFYCKREQEPPMLVDNLDRYKTDAVCLIDLSSQGKAH